MTARLRFFGAKRWAEGIYLAESHGCGFDVQLAGLREECLLIEVVDGKERTRAFAGGGSNDRRIGQRESALVEEIAGSLDDFGTHAQNCGLALRAHPEMAMFHEEIGAVLFGSDRVGRGLGNALDHLHVRNIEFVPAVRALVGTNFAFDDHAGFLRERFDRVEDFRRDGVLGNNALNDARAVAELGEQELSTFAQVVEPATDGDRLALVLADF